MGQGGPKYCVRGMNGLRGNWSGRGIDRAAVAARPGRSPFGVSRDTKEIRPR